MISTHYDAGMGGLLVAYFIASVMLACGLILAFATKGNGRRYGMYLVFTALFLFLALYLFSPNNDRYRI